MTAVQVTAVQVMEGLHWRWPDSEYVKIAEAPDGPMRQGRKLDLLVVSTWKSRDYELDGIEIKVSVSDWMREVNEPAKADFWWRHTNRFWVAVPGAIAARVRETLPATWGLLAVSEGKASIVVKATRRDAERLSWPEVIGLLRAANGAGLAALQRAEQAGAKWGAENARRDFERASGDAALRERLEHLQAKVRAFTDASGIDLEESWNAAAAARLGGLVKAIERNLADIRPAVRQMRWVADRLIDQADAFQAAADADGRVLSGAHQ